MAKLSACAVLVMILGTACAKNVTIRPPVSTSLGYSVFQALGEINRAPIHVGLLLDPKLRAETIRVSKELATAEIAFGEIVSAKLIQALSYKFERITLVDGGNTPPLLLHLALEGEQPSVGVDIRQYPTVLTGAATFEVVAKVDARLRATLTDKGQTVWIGHARVVEEMVSGGAAYGVAEGSAQAAELANRATDKLVADLMLQIRRSSELTKFIEDNKR